MHGEWLSPHSLTPLFITFYVSIHSKWLSPHSLTPLFITFYVSIHGKWLYPLSLTHLKSLSLCLFMVIGYRLFISL